jgi:hypothetical protein
VFNRTVLYDSFAVDTFTNLKICPSSCSSSTLVPTVAPTSQPTNIPTVALSPNATVPPTISPTQAPSTVLTLTPTIAPTAGIVSYDVILILVFVRTTLTFLFSYDQIFFRLVSI